MSVQSDVFVCMKTEMSASIPGEIREWMSTFFDVEDRHRLGTAFFAVAVRWYTDEDDEVKAFYTWLWQHAAEDFLVIEACLDDPEWHDGDAGAWYDNPWGAERAVSVRIDWEPQA